LALVPFPGPHTGSAAHAHAPTEEDEESPGGQMSFLEHLDELRKRIVSALLAVAVCVLLGFFLIDRISGFLLGPTRRILPPGSKMIYTQPGEAFAFNIQIALIAGVVLAAPWIMYQVWMFIAPGLYAKEKKMAVPFVVLSTVGFISGALFNHYLAFVYMMKFFASFHTDDLVFLPRLEDVFSLYTTMLIGMGLVFQMPTVIYFLARMNLVTWKFLARNFKYAFLLIFIAAAVITPSGDMITQAIFAAPMVGLYLLGIFIAWAVGPKRRAEAPS
jgi:sec-independent protein translocase protein TatC